MVKLLALILTFTLTESALGKASCNPRNIDTSCEGNPVPLHLTFDDGPHGNTAEILKILKRTKVKASFFVLGDHLIDKNCLEKNSKQYELLNQMVDEGHRVGSHTYSHIKHVDYVNAGKAWKANIDKSFTCEGEPTILSSFFKPPPPMVRLPYGQGYFEQAVKKNRKSGLKIMSYLREQNLVHVAWNIDSEDWKERTHKPGMLLEKIVNQMCQTGGGIVLMHDHSIPVKNELACVISELKKGGNSFKDLSFFNKVRRDEGKGLKLIGDEQGNLKVKSVMNSPAPKTKPCEPSKLYLDKEFIKVLKEVQEVSE